MTGSALVPDRTGHWEFVSEDVEAYWKGCPFKMTEVVESIEREIDVVWLLNGIVLLPVRKWLAPLGMRWVGSLSAQRAGANEDPALSNLTADWQ